MRRLASALLLALLVSACAQEDDAQTPDETSVQEGPGVVEVVARDLTFVAPDTIPPGWTTFRFVNTSPMEHFAIVQRLPEGRNLMSHQDEVAPVFQRGFDLLTSGDVEAAMSAFGELPAWFSDVVFLGGPGLTSPGRTSEASVRLEPGTYLLECYVKTDGRFHSYNPEGIGMVHEIVVAGTTSGATEPTADVRLTIGSGDGIRADGPVEPGTRTFAVDFVDNRAHENFVGHDVHLVRMDDDVALEDLEAWMDWTRPGGLETPAPAVFLGGLNEMPGGATGYFTVDMEPGNYAWVAEVPGASAKGMLVPFEVSGGS